MSSGATDQAIQRAMQHHEAGRLAEAEAIYREVLAQQPARADVLHLLGVLATQTGRLDLAIELIGRAVLINPHAADYFINLGIARAEKKQWNEAAEAYRAALLLKPQSHAARNNLGNILAQQGLVDAAITEYYRAIAMKPGYSDAYINLGSALKQRGQLVEAVHAYRQAIGLKPQAPAAHYNLGIALMEQGQVAAAVEAFQEALRLRPSHAETQNHLVAAQIQFGNQLKEQGFLDQAALCYQKAIQIKPADATAYFNLGVTRDSQGMLDNARAAYARAIELDPRSADAYNNLGNVLKDQGLLEQAMDSYDRAVALKPDSPVFHGNKVCALLYQARFDPAAIYREHCGWNQRHAEALGCFVPKHENAPDPRRRLKIGYVSPDLHWHPVGRFLLPLLQCHDPAEAEVVCYSDTLAADPMTGRLRKHTEVWRDTAGLTDIELAQLARQDQIDILVDLSGHTANNRLLVFARKPAPIQMTWLGYPDTTGMTAMDYRITDSHADPPGMTEQFCAERLERMPDSFLCFAPPEEAIAVAAAPALTRGHVTFGSFNTLAKINVSTVALWAQILQRVRGSRLLLKAGALSSTIARQNLLNLFAGRGIAADRLELRPPVASHRDHLQMYHEVDIALDTFRYHGTTITCEALWMGVPVICLAGPTHVSRVGVSILSNIGLGERVAQSADEYVQNAVELAGDLSRLSALRPQLRERMRESPLMNAPRFARNMEKAYRTVWRRWCEKP